MLLRLLSLSFLLLSPAGASDKPNILLFLIDDMGAVDLGCYGSSLHRTQQIDKLAASGLRFTQAYAACHVCSPTRASLQTGKYPARIHLTDWLTGHVHPHAKLKVPNWEITGPTTNEPLREGKGTLYEGGARVPMIVRWPGKTPAGTTSDAMFNSIDLMPTLAAITGAKAPDGIDGLDFSQAWKGGPSPARDTLCWHYPHYHRGMPGGSIRKGNWKLIEWFETGKEELYDLSKDPSEKTDLSKSNPERATELLAMLKKWRADTGAQMMTPNPDYDPKKSDN